MPKPAIPSRCSSQWASCLCTLDTVYKISGPKQLTSSNLSASLRSLRLAARIPSSASMKINCFRTYALALLLTSSVVIQRVTQPTANRFAEYSDIGLRAGLTTQTIIGDENGKKYPLEITGRG